MRTFASLSYPLCFSSALAFAAAATLIPAASARAADAPLVATGFCIDSLVQLPTNGLAWGPGGAWGLDLYAASNDSILRIAPDGTTTTLATGLVNPTGIAFSDAGGPFGDFLYVLQDAQAVSNVVRITSTGVVTSFATLPPTVQVDPKSLAFSRGLGGYPDELYVTDFAGCGCTAGRIFRFTPGGVATPVLIDFGVTPTGIAFVSGGVFGASTLLYGDILNGVLDDGAFWTISPTDVATVLHPTLNTPLFNPSHVGQGTAAPFGTDIYLSDVGNYNFAVNTVTYYRRDSSGLLSVFLTGLSENINANRVAFRGDGLVLAVNSKTDVYLVRQAPLIDLSGDGVVNGADLGLLLTEWGQVESFADLNCDGIVDGADLGLLLAAWT